MDPAAHLVPEVVMESDLMRITPTLEGATLGHPLNSKDKDGEDIEIFGCIFGGRQKNNFWTMLGLDFFGMMDIDI